MTHRLDLTDDEALMLKALVGHSYVMAAFAPALVMFGSAEVLAGLIRKIREIRASPIAVLEESGR